MTKLTTESVRVATTMGPKDGLLVFCNSVLIAVLTHLSSAVHGENRGRWFLETGFGPCSDAGEQLFDSSDDALAWAEECGTRKPHPVLHVVMGSRAD